MSEMVERMARGMHASTDMIWSQLPWDRLGAAQELYLSLARAAIAEMREPTRLMIRAGGEIAENDRIAEATWANMIDAALK